MRQFAMEQCEEEFTHTAGTALTAGRAVGGAALCLGFCCSEPQEEKGNIASLDPCCLPPPEAAVG